MNTLSRRWWRVACPCLRRHALGGALLSPSAQTWAAPLAASLVQGPGRRAASGERTAPSAVGACCPDRARRQVARGLLQVLHTQTSPAAPAQGDRVTLDPFCG